MYIYFLFGTALALAIVSTEFVNTHLTKVHMNLIC